MSPLSFTGRFILLILGAVLTSAGVAMYMHSETGTGPYDALPLIVENKTKKRIPFSVARVILDLLAVAVGFVFGATVGIGTLLTAFFMGPIIEYFRNFLREYYSLVIDST